MKVKSLGLAVAVTGAVLLVPAREAAAQAGPLSFFPLTPCRIIDTRGTPGPTGGPALSANTQRSFPVRGACGVPASAAASVMNVTITEPTDFGNLRVFPAGVPAPLASVINWTTADFALANGAIIPLGTSGSNHITVQTDMVPTSTGTVHLVVDVTGYFQ